MDIALILSIIIAFVAFYIHTFIGGKYVARPLLKNTSLPKAAKWLSYFCWHIATVLLLAIGFVLIFDYFYKDNNYISIFISVLSLILSLLSAFAAMKGKINPFKFPSTSLFAILAVLLAISVLK